MNISFVSILLMNLFYLFINEMPRNRSDLFMHYEDF